MNLMSKELTYSEKYHDYTISISFERKWINLTMWEKRDEDHQDHKIQLTVESIEEAQEIIQALQKLITEAP